MEANVTFKCGPTPTLTTDFISRVENANPYVPDLSEDNSGPSWGHSQFTGGNMTLTTVFTVLGIYWKHRDGMPLNRSIYQDVQSGSTHLL
jgi:hypothetical protein